MYVRNYFVISSYCLDVNNFRDSFRCCKLFEFSFVV